MFTKKEVNYLSKVSELNHSVDKMIKDVNDLNIMAMTIVAKKDPKNLTQDMIVAMASQGIDPRDINEDIKDVLPECFEVYREGEEPSTVKETSRISHKKVNVRNAADKSSAAGDMVRPKDIPDIQLSTSEVPPTGKFTGNIVHDDLKKRGVIFAKCNKSPEIEERVVDELIQAADDRDIMIQEFIVNEKEGVKTLKAWMESGVIDYIIMNELNAYSQNQVAQFFLLDDAYRRGIKILLKDNDFNPVFPF